MCSCIKDHIVPYTHCFNDEQYAHFLQTYSDRFKILQICCSAETNCQACNYISSLYSNLSKQPDEYKYCDSESIQVFVQTQKQYILKLFYKHLYGFQQQHFDIFEDYLKQNCIDQSQDEVLISSKNLYQQHTGLKEPQSEEVYPFQSYILEQNYCGDSFIQSGTYLSQQNIPNEQLDQATFTQILQVGSLDIRDGDSLLLMNEQYNQTQLQTEYESIPIDNEVQFQQVDFDYEADGIIFEIGWVYTNQKE
ncbi:hypothetical protein ABPG74_020600 [Tetrahymena malaccensis]